MTDAPRPHAKADRKHDRREPKAKWASGRLIDAAVANPLTMVAGGLAVGAVVGALLPRSERERALLAPVGQRLGTGAVAAFHAAKDAGMTELDQAGISRDNAREQARGLVASLVRAASAAGTAAVDAAGKSAT